MTIFEKDNWKLRWGLYWTWPHAIYRASSRIRDFYFGPFVLEVSDQFLAENNILGEDEDQGWIPLFIMFVIGLIAYLIS